MTTLFELPPERTEFADEAYGVLGRALTYGAKFERDSKALSELTGIKSGRMETKEDSELFGRELTRHFKIALKSHHTNIQKALDSPTVGLLLPNFGNTLDRARQARNWIAHEATLGLESRLESDAERAQLIRDVRARVEDIVRAHLPVLVAMAVLTHEEIPLASMDFFTHRIGDWVCDVED
jgi:acetylornithine deacetylase/succinyl-diaminopimelate desuccinylase-like protein